MPAALAAAFLLARPSRAQNDGAIDACHNKSSTVEIVDCLDDLTAEWDKKLNTSYQLALKRADTPGIAPLRASERAWLDYRKQRCAYLSSGQGTIMAVLGSDCMLRMTKARAEELAEDAKGLGG